jgi:hypothetical protein
MMFKVTGSKPSLQGGSRQSGVPKVKMGPMTGTKGAKKVA